MWKLNDSRSDEGDPAVSEAITQALRGCEVGLSEDGRVEISLQDRAVVLRMSRADAKALALLISAAARRATK